MHARSTSLKVVLVACKIEPSLIPSGLSGPGMAQGVAMPRCVYLELCQDEVEQEEAPSMQEAHFESIALGKRACMHDDDDADDVNQQTPGQPRPQTAPALIDLAAKLTDFAQS
eukprot:382402-Pelagomonas_calceolata.AAC.6